VATRLVALLRGINVGRNKRVAMAQLRDLLLDLGYIDVRTILQSGNVAFTSSSADTAAVAGEIRRALTRELKLECAVIVRTAPELANIVVTDPFGDVASDPARYLVGFLAGPPDASGAAAVKSLVVAPNLLRMIGRELYLWCPDGVLQSPFATVNWDKQLGVAVTMRNWRTVTRLAELGALKPSVSGS
jgi:uncharacterized protein (DUF1697 family)